MVKEKYQNISISTIDRVGPVFLVHLGNDGFGISITGADFFINKKTIKVLDFQF